MSQSFQFQFHFQVIRKICVQCPMSRNVAEVSFSSQANIIIVIEIITYANLSLITFSSNRKLFVERLNL